MSLDKYNIGSDGAVNNRPARLKLSIGALFGLLIQPTALTLRAKYSATGNAIIPINLNNRFLSHQNKYNSATAIKTTPDSFDKRDSSRQAATSNRLFVDLNLKSNNRANMPKKKNNASCM